MAGDGRTTAGPMPLVVDASVLVKLVVEEPGTPQALALLDRDELRIAPDWALIEVANALWNKVKFSQLLEIHAEDSLQNVPEFVDRFIPSRDLLADAFQLSFRIRHPLYDALYLALAMREDARVITADREFFNAADKAGLGDLVELLSPDPA